MGNLSDNLQVFTADSVEHTAWPEHCYGNERKDELSGMTFTNSMVFSVIHFQ